MWTSENYESSEWLSSNYVAFKDIEWVEAG